METPKVLDAKTVSDKPLSSVTEHEWYECQQLAEKSIKYYEPELDPGPGLVGTGERVVSTYGGALGAITALISAKSRLPETGTEEQTEEQIEESYYTYWNTFKECLRDKGYLISDDSVEVERP